MSNLIKQYLKNKYKNLSKVQGYKEYHEIISNSPYIFAKNNLFFVKTQDQEKFSLCFLKVDKNKALTLVDVFNNKIHELTMPISAKKSENKISYFKAENFFDEMVYVLNYHDLFDLSKEVNNDQYLQKLLKEYIVSENSFSK